MKSHPRFYIALNMLILLALLMGVDSRPLNAQQLPPIDNGSKRASPLSVAIPSSEETALEGIVWWLILLKRDQEMVSTLPGTVIRIEFEGEYLGGFSGCNWYSSTYIVDGSNLDVSWEEFITTLRDCAHQPGVGEQEGLYQALLLEASSYEISENELQMFDADGELTLIFRQLAQTQYLPIIGHHIESK